jgi:hypothetical protein
VYAAAVKVLDLLLSGGWYVVQAPANYRDFRNSLQKVSQTRWSRSIMQQLLQVQTYAMLRRNGSSTTCWSIAQVSAQACRSSPSTDCLVAYFVNSVWTLA